MMQQRAVGWIGFAVLALAGCQPIVPPAATTPAATLPPAAATLTLDNSTVITQENSMSGELPSSHPQVLQAMKDLAQALSIQIDQITLVSAEAVVWPDGSLGCPQPGMMYMQVLQDGMRIILSANGQEYHYHSGELRPPFLCENPAP